MVTHSSAWWLLVVFAIAPDLALLGSTRGLQRGQIQPNMVPLYKPITRAWLRRGEDSSSSGTAMSITPVASVEKMSAAVSAALRLRIRDWAMSPA